MQKRDNPFIYKLIERLKSEYGSKKIRSNNTTLQGLRCPACGDTTAWCYLERPYSINCNRLSECGIHTKVKDLFPDYFQTIEQSCPPSSDDPDKPGRVYLETRGIRQALIGLQFSYWRSVRNLPTGAVMFPVSKTAEGKMIYNGRLLNPPKSEGKTHNSGGSTAGVFWVHPGRKIDPDKPVYITEGIIDSLSLIESGLQSIAALSAGQDPSRLNIDGYKHLVIAFDNDHAGISSMRRWIAYFKNKCSISAILPDKGKDWNDYLQEFRGQHIKSFFEKKMPEFKFNAELCLASTAQAHLDTFLAFKGFSPQLFEFNGAYYHAKPQYKNDRYYAVQVSDFTLETNFYLLDATIRDKRIYSYGLTIYPQGRKKIHTIFEAKDIATTRDLTTAMLTRARCSWSGDRISTSLLSAMIVKSGAHELRQLQAIGYDEQTNSYIFPEFMIDPSGRMVSPENGLYSFQDNQYVRPAQFKTIHPSSGYSARELWSILISAWGDRAATAVAWVAASWFVSRVRMKTGFFPFLSLYFDPQTGKSALMRCLNRMQAIDEEGLAMSHGNTIIGLIRKLSQKSSLFTGLSEINRDGNTKMPIDSILSWYDGSPLSTRGAYSNGNEVIEIPFRGAVMFCQNKEPFLTTPQKERVVSIKFEKEMITPESREAFLKLTGITASQFAQFFIQIMESRLVIENEWFHEFITAKNELHGITETSNRLVDTHSLVLAFHRLFCRILRVNYDLKDYIVEIMKQKHVSSQENETNPAEVFFAEVASYLRISKINNMRQYLQFIDYDSKSHCLWLHPYELVSVTQPSPLSRLPFEKIRDSLKEHPALTGKPKAHRFKFYKSDTHEFIVDVKKGWCFNFDKLSDDFDFDIHSLNWL